MAVKTSSVTPFPGPPIITQGFSIIDFGAFPGNSDTSLVVTGQLLIQLTSVITVSLSLVTSPDHSADEHWVESIRVFAGAVVVGSSFTIYGRNDCDIVDINSGWAPRIYGKWNVQWRWS